MAYKSPRHESKNKTYHVDMADRTEDDAVSEMLHIEGSFPFHEDI